MQPYSDCIHGSFTRRKWRISRLYLPPVFQGPEADQQFHSFTGQYLYSTMRLQHILIASLLGCTSARVHDAHSTQDMRARGSTDGSLEAQTCSVEKAGVRKEWYVELSTFDTGEL